MRSKLFLGAVAFLLLSPLLAAAQGTSCPSDPVRVPDGTRFTGSIPNVTSHFFFLPTVIGHAYTVRARFPGANAGPTLTLRQGFGGTVCDPATNSVNTGSIDPSVCCNTGASLSFIADATTGGATTGGGGPGAYFEIANSSGGTQSYELSLTDTTFFSSRWSTFGNFYTSWGIFNTSRTNVSCTLTVTTSAGAQVATATFTVTANRVSFRDTRASDLNIAASQAGSVQLACLAPPGSMTADAFLVNETTTPVVVVPEAFAPRNAQH